ncbi:low affinity immunoglobulin epsilon Fc receptor-like [Saccostrea cucullata]|uniref:low affinity immunoglobulin epsilon Fc receptor-like n=1 Tax=Saccostrea cuccullata TaxID=36930 RepID=UPI002ED2352A
MDWDVAKGECNRNNAKLVEIETESENSWIMETFLPTEADCPSFWGCSVWIGATDRDMEGRFVWDSDQRPVNFTRWSPGNPNNEGPSGEQHCVDLMISGEWDDGECEALMGFVCEMDY